MRSSPRRGAGRAGLVLALGVALAVTGCAGKALPIPTPPPPASVGPGSGGPGGPGGSGASASPGDSGASTSAVDGFRSLVSSDSASYRIALKGDLLATVSDLSIKGSIAVAGQSFSTTTAYTFDLGGTATVDTRYVGGTLWVRQRGPGLSGKWTKAKNLSALVAPFAGIDAPGAITDFGPKTVKGKAVRELQVLGGRLVDPFTIPAINLTEERVTSAILTLDIDGSGRPVSGRWKQTGQGRVSGQLQEVDVDVDVTFSDVGAKITITAP